MSSHNDMGSAAGPVISAQSCLCRHVWLDFTRQLPVTKELDEQDLDALTAAWCSKKLSNLDYLLHLNRLAGRRLGDRTFHPYLPWSAVQPCHPFASSPQLTLV